MASGEAARDLSDIHHHFSCPRMHLGATNSPVEAVTLFDLAAEKQFRAFARHKAIGIK
jgi:hypothetical protein